MADTDFTLATNQEILKWVFGKSTLPQPTLPLQARWMSSNNSSSLTAGTEVSGGAPTRINLNFTNANANYIGEGYSISRVDDTTSGSLVWPSASSTILGNEIWDSGTPPRRLMYDKGDVGYTVNTGDVMEWDAQSCGIALLMLGFDSAIAQQALNWALGKTTGWTRPQGPFKIKLRQYEDLTYSTGPGSLISSPKSVLESAPMQTVTFGNIESNGDNQAVIRSDINVVFPSFSDTNSVFVQGYEIWDSSSTPRKLCSRKPGQDYIRDGYGTTWVSVAPGNTLTIPLGTLKFSLGRGDGSG